MCKIRITYIYLLAGPVMVYLSSVVRRGPGKERRKSICAVRSRIQPVGNAVSRGPRSTEYEYVVDMGNLPFPRSVLSCAYLCGIWCLPLFGAFPLFLPSRTRISLVNNSFPVAVFAHDLCMYCAPGDSLTTELPIEPLAVRIGSVLAVLRGFGRVCWCEK
jgi:hypothetical protein